jgi:hypothetical protein
VTKNENLRKWRKMAKKGRKVAKSGEKWQKVAKICEFFFCNNKQNFPTA